MFDLADTKGAGSTWQPPELAAPSLSVQMIWSAGHKQTLSCMLFVSLVALDPGVVQRGWISEALKVTPLVLYPVWILEHLPQPPVCLVLPFISQQGKPWVGGSSNKTPEVLTAELIWWQNDSIQLRPRCCLWWLSSLGNTLKQSKVPNYLWWRCPWVFSTSFICLALKQDRPDPSGEVGLVDVCCETRVIGNSCYISSWLVSGSFCPFPCT